MRPVSERFLRTLTGSHTAIFRARIVEPGQTGVNPAGVEFKIIDGDVQLDAGADIRSTLEITVDGAGQWPDESTDLLAPYGNEVFVERGIAYGGGSTEMVSLGYFRIDDVEQEQSPDGPIRIVGTDRMSMIVDGKLTEVRQYPATATYGEVVDDLVLDAYAAAVITWDDADVRDAPIGRTLLVEEDRYAAVKELVTGQGKIAYFDHRGELLIRSPAAADDAVWTVARGESGVLVAASRSLSRSGVYNGVLALGEALDTEPPARGLAVDTGDGSPTLWGGPFGKVPRTYSSPLLTTDAQAQLAAATILRRSLGLPYNVDLTAVPNPALEPDDPIAVGLAGRPTSSARQLLAADSFTRVEPTAWGVSERGDTWTTSATPHAVNGSVATLSFAVDNITATRLNGADVGRRDADCYADVRVPAAVTGAPLIVGVALRAASTTDNYAARLEFNPGGTVTTKLARRTSGGSADLAALADFDTYTTAEWWTLRGRVRGSVLFVKAWRRGSPEPREWLLTYDDPNAHAVTGTRFGLYFWRLIGNTTAAPHYEIDNWRAYTAPPETLRGGELHVIDSLTIPLTAAGAMTASTREQSLTTIEATS